MADRQCTRFIDEDGLDIGCALVTKEYMLEAYPDLVPWMKTPGLWLWGQNSSGPLGDNSNISKSSPIQTVSAGVNWKNISVGRVPAAIKTDGTLWLWGDNIFGFLGDNTTINKSSPIQTVSGGTDWKTVSVGFANIAAIKTDGTLWLWGGGGFGGSRGVHGDNTSIDKSSPVQTISGGTNWCTVSSGNLHTVAIKTDGTLWIWGNNCCGALGINAAFHRSSPVQTVSGGTDWKSASAGQNHTAAIKKDGSLWNWGAGTYGRLGDNTATNKSSPVQTVSGGNNWRTVSSGSFVSMAIKTDGTLWLWGNGSSGRLGNNATTCRSSPVQTVSRGTNWRSLGANFHSNTLGALKTDGTLWLWGAGFCGYLGNNSTINRSSPVQTISGGNNWKISGIGSSASAAIRDEGDY